MENYYSDEELDLKLILLYVLKKWKPILLVSFVGLLLGSCLSLFRMQNNSPESILKRLNKLEESDINEYNIQLYSDYKKLYDAHVAYENDSALMKLDANNVYTGNLVYSISAENKDIDSIGASLSGVLEINNNLEGLAESTDYSAEELRELIDIKFSRSDKSSLISTDNNANGLLSIKVYGVDHDSVEDIVNKLETLVNSTLKSIRGDYSGESIIKVQDSVVFGTDLDLLGMQSEETRVKQNILTSLTNAEAKLSDDEKMYYGYYYNYDEYFAETKSHFSKKWPVVLCVAGGVLACAWYFFVFLFDGHFKSEDEYRDRYGLKLLSVIDLNKKEYKGIDKIINGFEKVVFNDDEYLKSVLRSFGDKKVFLCTDNEKLKEKIGNEIRCFGTLDIDNKAVDELRESDGVILSSEIGKTEYKLIERQIEVAKRNDKEVFGIISIR